MPNSHALPIFIDTAPVFRREGGNIHVTGSIDGVAYHRVVPLAVLHIAVYRALALLTGPNGSDVAQIRCKGG